MKLSNLKSVVDQVAESEQYKDVSVNVKVDQIRGKELLQISLEDPPNYYSPEVVINATDATLELRDGVNL